MVKELLFKIAKSPFMGGVVGMAFRFCSPVIPVKKVFQSREIIAFYHPKPSYRNHLIITPKRAIKSLRELSREKFFGYFPAILSAAYEISGKDPKFGDNFTLIANGGPRQEVGQVHLHMFTNHKSVNDYHDDGQQGEVIYRDEYIRVMKHPESNWEIHYLLLPGLLEGMSGDKDFKNRYFQGVLRSIELLDEKSGIVKRGYSLVHQYEREATKAGLPIFHIIAGKKIQKAI